MSLIPQNTSKQYFFLYEEALCGIIQNISKQINIRKCMLLGEFSVVKLFCFSSIPEMCHLKYCCTVEKKSTFPNRIFSLLFGCVGDTKGCFGFPHQGENTAE